VLVIGVEVGGSRQRGGNPENEQQVLVFGVEGGGGKQRKVATPKNERFCSFSGLGGDGCRWVVGDQREVVTVAGGW
jgi:hypothetical protein